MKVTITFEGYIVGSGDPDVLQAQFDAVMNELIDLGVEDPAIGARLEAREVEISVTVDADSLDDAAQRGFTTIRSAVHAAGFGTPGWSVDWVGARTAYELTPA